MIYLLLCVLAGSTMTIVFKLAAQKNRNSDRIMLVNYAAAIIISLISAWNDGVILGQVQTDGETAKISMLLVATIGVGLGIIYLVNLLITNASIIKNGAVLSTFFFKASFVGVVLLSALIWAEIPSIIQCLGIALIFAALFLISGSLKDMQAQAPVLLALLLMNGILIEMSFKAFAEYARPEYKSVMVLIIFSVAFVLCVVKNIYSTAKSGQKFRLSFPELILGICVGAANTMVSMFQLKALETLPASLVYPTQAAGNLLMIFLLGKLLFREPSGKKEGFAVGLAVISLVLINL